MTITTKTRPQLKSYFVKNAIPAQSHFADLIDAQLNQAEDGVFKRADEPLSVVAAPGPQRRVLRLYSTFPAQSPDWLISLSPTQDPNNVQTARPGLGITDAAGVPRLFLDLATGNVGVGTNNPGANRLLVAGDARVEGNLATTGTVTAGGRLTASAGITVPTGQTLIAHRIGVGTDNPQSEFVVVTGGIGGLDRLAVSSTTFWDGTNRYATISGPMYFNPHVPWIPWENRASIRMGRSGQTGALWDVGTRTEDRFSFAVNGTNHTMWLFANGNVGIGTDNPGTNRLQVEGNTRITGTLTATGTVQANSFTGANSLVLDDFQTVNPASNVLLVAPPGDRDAWIYRDPGDPNSNWGIYHRQINTAVKGLPGNAIGFVGGGNSGLRAHISLTDGSASFGPLTTSGLTVNTGGTSVAALTASGSVTASAGLSIGTAGILSLGSQTRQMINLWGTEFGIGVQSATTYFRTFRNFAFYQGGVHNDAELNPGGGATLMVIRAGNVGIGTADPGTNRLQVEGATRLGGTVTATGLLTASAGLSVTGGTSSVAALSASGLVTAGAGLSVTGNTSVAALSASGLVTAGAGLSVTGNASVAALSASGLVTAGAGLSVTGNASVAALSASGLVTAGAGLSVTGNASVAALSASGLVTAGAGLSVTGTSSVAALSASGLVTAGAGLSVSGVLSFGTQSRQMVNLVNADHGIGVQSWTTYFRSARNFAFYQGGTHNDAELGAGGGTAAMVIRSGNVGIGTDNPGTNRLQVEGATRLGGTVTATGLVTASAGLTVTGGTSSVAALTASGLVTASAGLTVGGGTTTTLTGNLNVSGSVTLGYAWPYGNLNAAGASGFYQGDNATGRPPDEADARTHIISVRHGNGANFHQLQIASSYAENNKLYFRKIARPDLSLATSAWNEVATITDGLLLTQSLQATGTLTGAGLNVTGNSSVAALAASGLVTAGAGLSVTGNATVSGALTGTGRVTASNGLTVTAGGLLVSAGGANVTGGLTVAGTSSVAALTASGLVTASAGLTVTGGTSSVAALTASGLLTASAGISVTGGVLTTTGNVGLGNANPGGNRLLVEGATRITGALATGTVAVSGGLTATAAISTTGDITADGYVRTNGGLFAPEGRGIHADGSLVVDGPVVLGAPSRLGIRLQTASSQHVVLPTIPDTIPTNLGVTFQAWIYPTSYSGLVFDLQGNRIQLEPNGVLWYVNAATNVPNVPTPAGSIPLNAWTHIAVTVDSAGACRIYRNGVQIASGPVAVIAAATRTQCYIGRGWNGYITEASLWTGVRGVAMGPLAGNEPGLVGYWRLRGDALDSCTNTPRIGNGTLSGANGTLPTFVNSPSSTQPGILQEDWLVPTLAAGWALYSPGFSPPGFFRDAQGVVHLRGLVDNKSATQVLNNVAFPGVTLFDLPAGYRPQDRTIFAVASNNAFGRVDVDTSGRVSLLVFHPTWVSLDGISFRAFS